MCNSASVDLVDLAGLDFTENIDRQGVAKGFVD